MELVTETASVNAFSPIATLLFEVPPLSLAKALVPRPIVLPVEFVSASLRPSISVAPPPAAVWNVGAEPAPFEVNTCPLVPTAVAVTAPVPLPTKTPFAVNVPAPVPPCATLRSVVSPVRDVISELAPDDAALSAVLAALADVAPVPPLAIARVPVVSVARSIAFRVIV